ncbi:hypothetical protein GCM10020367_69870 [Streptomyces sannanensis]|uniref:Uncharacterized protein n=1 Tax=Streptomyces sannanensis TaxID=285536 RepID=A0ABP6SMK2_9ACTN
MATAYGIQPEQVLGHFTVTGSRPRHESGAVRADVELLLNGAGQRMLTELSGVGLEVLSRALPAFSVEDTKAGGDEGVARAVWRVGGAVAGRWRSGAGCARHGAAGPGRGSYATRRGGIGCAHGMHCGGWTRTPTRSWSIWICAACQKCWPRGGGGRLWLGVRGGLRWRPSRCSAWRTRSWRWWDQALYWEQEKRGVALGRSSWQISGPEH